MGCCNSTPNPVVDLASREMNRTINRQIQDELTQNRGCVKLLLLGAGECGKSTILKQMQILHKNGFSLEDKKRFAPLVQYNTLQSIQALCYACHQFNIALQSPIAQAWSEAILKMSSHDSVIPAKDMIKGLWLDGGIQEAFSRSNEFQILDNAPYFMVHVDRTLTADYLPTEQDILRTRRPTSGITETEFLIEGISFKMVDIGGQRGERKKWIHCFEDIRAIFFVASLSEYDQMLWEDQTRNRLTESLALFEGIISLSWFRTTSIILFLNKNDIFQQKIRKTDLGIYFSAYSGGVNNYDKALHFIQELYFSKNRTPSKTIYAHVTDATDTNQISFVWQATKHIVMQANLSKAGLRLL